MSELNNVDWIDVVSADALPIIEHVVVDVDGTDVAVFKLVAFFAIEMSAAAAQK